MNCLEFRRLKLSDPTATNAELDTHQETCAACRRYDAELKQIDDGIQEAFEIPVPENLAAKVMLQHSLQSRRKRPIVWQWLSVAASVAVIAVLVTAVLQPTPVTALEADLAEHLGPEENMAKSQGPMPTNQVSRTISDAGIKTAFVPENVVHAKVCIVNGRVVAHLVIRENDNDFTVMLLPDAVEAPSTFRASGWNGVLRETPFGAVAVLSNSSQELVAALGTRLVRSLGSTGD